MTQEDKELLLKDIYARIPYGVKGCCEGETFRTTPLHWYAEHTLEYSVNYMVIKNGWRPYLFPLSSMSGKQYVEFVNLGNATSDDCFDGVNFNQLDWLNAHHFDYRGLIEKGLAIDAAGLNIY